MINWQVCQQKIIQQTNKKLNVQASLNCCLVFFDVFFACCFLVFHLHLLRMLFTILQTFCLVAPLHWTGIKSIFSIQGCIQYSFLVCLKKSHVRLWARVKFIPLNGKIEKSFESKWQMLLFTAVRGVVITWMNTAWLIKVMQLAGSLQTKTK